VNLTAVLVMSLTLPLVALHARLKDRPRLLLHKLCIDLLALDSILGVVEDLPISITLCLDQKKLRD